MDVSELSRVAYEEDRNEVEVEEDPGENEK